MKKNLDDFIQKVEDNTNETLEDTLLDEDAKLESTSNMDYKDIVKNSAQDKMSKIPWLTAIFLILIIAVVFITMFLRSNPQTIFTMAIDDYISSISDNIRDVNYDISKGNIKVNINNENGSKINLNAKYVIDNTNNLSYVKLLPKENSKLDFSMYSDNKDVYIYSKNIFDKNIKLNKTRPYKMIGSKDSLIILNGINQSLDKVATSEKISGGKTSLDVGDKTVKVYMSKLIINKENYERVCDLFINNLKSNEEFITALSKTKNSDSESVRKALDDFLIKLKSKYKQNIEIKLYTDKNTNKFIKGEFNGESISFSLIKNDNINEFSINSNDINGNFIFKINKNKYDIKFDYSALKDGKKDHNTGSVNITNKKALSFGKVNVDDFVNETDLTDAEKFNIYTKLITNDELNGFIKMQK